MTGLGLAEKRGGFSEKRGAFSARRGAFRPKPATPALISVLRVYKTRKRFGIVGLFF